MHLPDIRARVFAVSATVLAIALASCAKPPPPPPPPPPPAPVPMRPYPPQGASPGYVLPPMAPDGRRVTVNTGISPEQTTWNLRAAFNVAALNCLRPQHAQILDAYKAFLTNNKRELLATYKEVEAGFKEKHGAKRGLFERDIYMTQVYNYFAFPPTLMDFCDGVLALGLESMTVKPADMNAFAARSLPVLDGIFQDFYTRYDRYKVELAHWDADYGALYGPNPIALNIPPATAPYLGSGTPAPAVQIILPPTTTAPSPLSATTAADPRVGMTVPDAAITTPTVATP